MEIKNRLKLVIKHLVGKGIAPNQKGVGLLIGYKTESAFSQVINGKVSMPEDFIDKLVSLDDELDKNWIITGSGSMIKKLYHMNENDDISFDYKKLAEERLQTIDRLDKFIKRLEKDIELLEAENNSLKKENRRLLSMHNVSKH